MYKDTDAAVQAAIAEMRHSLNALRLELPPSIVDHHSAICENVVAKLAQVAPAVVEKPWDELCPSCKGEDVRDTGGPDGCVSGPCTCHPALARIHELEADLFIEEELAKDREAEKPAADAGALLPCRACGGTGVAT